MQNDSKTNSPEDTPAFRRAKLINQETVTRGLGTVVNPRPVQEITVHLLVCMATVLIEVRDVLFDAEYSVRKSLERSLEKQPGKE
jgi:hypothetical protein